MEIIESLLTGKKSQETCEDGIVVTPDYVAVVDGSTSKTQRRLSPDMANGRLAMMTLCNYIQTLPPALTAEEFCQSVTQHFDHCYRHFQADPERLLNHPEERLTASTAIYSRWHRQIWLVGDCQALVNDQYHDNPKPHEQLLAQRRATVIRTALETGADPKQFFTNDTGREAILPDLIQSCTLQNKDFAVVDGFPIPLQHVVIIPVPQSCEVVLATDGYPFLASTLAESERLLHEQIEQDPLNIHRFMATKGLRNGQCSFDDRAYVRFRI